MIPGGLLVAYIATRLTGRVHPSERGLTVVGVAVGGGLVAG